MTVVVFGAEKGGVGKTSVALNFVTLAAQSGVDAVLLDTDRQKTASNWLELRAGEEGLTPISVLGNAADPLREVVSLARRYELVVVDIGAQNYRWLIESAALADVFVIPASTSALDLDTAEDLYEVLCKVKPADKNQGRACVRVLLSKVPSHPLSKELDRTRHRLQENKVAYLKTALPARSSWRSMANTGKALNELTGKNFDPRAADEMSSLYKEIIKLVRSGGSK